MTTRLLLLLHLAALMRLSAPSCPLGGVCEHSTPSPLDSATAVMPEEEEEEELPEHVDHRDSLHERHLHNAMFERYDPSIRPVQNFSHPVKVGFEVTVHKILDLNEKDQTLSVNMWLTMVWEDLRLRWDQRKYDRKHTRAKINELWRPDVRLYNRAEGYNARGYKQVNAVAFSNGTLQWIPPILSRSLCPIDVFYFPFDAQLCALIFGSGSYDITQLDMQPLNAQPDLSEYLASGEWIMVEPFYRRRTIQSPMMNQTFAVVVVYFCLQRRALYYFINVVTPCTCLNLLCLASFWTPAEESGKVGLTLSTMLSYFLYVNTVSERLPRSHRIPILGIYLLGSMFLSVVSVIIAVVTVHFRARGFAKHAEDEKRLEELEAIYRHRPRPPELEQLRRKASGLHKWVRVAGWINGIAFLASGCLLIAGLFLLLYMSYHNDAFARNMCDYYLALDNAIPKV